MAVMARESWTDERLDDLKAGMDGRFNRVDVDIRELRSETKKGFERVDDKFDSLQAEMNQRFDSMQRMMFIGFVTLFASIVGCVIGALFAV